MIAAMMAAVVKAASTFRLVSDPAGVLVAGRLACEGCGAGTGALLGIAGAILGVSGATTVGATAGSTEALAKATG